MFYYIRAELDNIFHQNLSSIILNLMKTYNIMIILNNKTLNIGVKHNKTNLNIVISN